MLSAYDLDRALDLLLNRLKRNCYPPFQRIVCNMNGSFGYCFKVSVLDVPECGTVIIVLSDSVQYYIVSNATSRIMFISNTSYFVLLIEALSKGRKVFA